MSKVGFSKKCNDVMIDKINAIENMNLEIFFNNDENFELIMCLAYMTLSKEEIIKKDIKNKKRLERLTRMIDQEEIDKLFEGEDAPKIKNTTENNNLWILDNIRDSIMHGAFEIDEDNKLFIINNTQYDRKLEVDVPFSWFIKYAKTDIINKKRLINIILKVFILMNKEFLNLMKQKNFI